MQHVLFLLTKLYRRMYQGNDVFLSLRTAGKLLRPFDGSLRPWTGANDGFRKCLATPIFLESLYELPFGSIPSMLYRTIQFKSTQHPRFCSTSCHFSHVCRLLLLLLEFVLSSIDFSFRINCEIYVVYRESQIVFSSMSKANIQFSSNFRHRNLP